MTRPPAPQQPPAYFTQGRGRSAFGDRRFGDRLASGDHKKIVATDVPGDRQGFAVSGTLTDRDRHDRLR
jgi:hypothetical protein